MDPAVAGLLDIRNRLLAVRGLLPTQDDVRGILSLIEMLVPPEELTKPVLRRGQHQFFTCRVLGMVARRGGTPLEDCPYPDEKGFSRVRFKAWGAGWAEENQRQEGLHREYRRACRSLTMKRPHGRAS